MDFKKQFSEGLLTKNPVTVQLLGMCSTLAITTSLFNGIGMGLAVTIILICSNVLISALRKVIPNQIRIAAYITIIAGFVTIVDLVLQAFLPDLAASLGVFIPLIVVNCIVLGRAEAFASKNGVLASAVDGLCQGVGYTVALVIVCVLRELLGNGTFGGGLLNGGEGIRIIPEGYPAMQLVMPVGGFLVLGFVIAGSQWLIQDCSFGELTLLVPRQYRVELSESAAFGSVDVEGHHDENPEGTILVDADASFGEITLRYV